MSPRYFDYDYGVTAVDTQYIRPGLAALYIVIENGKAALIETGTNYSVPDTLEVLRKKGVAREDVEYVIPTHVHLDHAGGAGLFMRELPSAKLVIHPRGARHMIDPSKLIAGTIAVYGVDATKKMYGDIVPVPAERVIEAPDLFTLDFNGRELLFIDTPGHARHHFCVYDERSGGMFTGDTLGISYREFDSKKGPFVFPTTTPVQFEPDALHASIDRLLGYHPTRAFLTHFGQVVEVERLADDMHDMIGEFVDASLNVKDTGAERHAALVKIQRDIIVPRIRKHGSPLKDAQIDALLDADYELNAQGIEVWLDRDQKR